MPKKIQFEEIKKGQEYSFKTKINLLPKSNAIIRVPFSVGEAVNKKKIKVTIEVLDDE